jgi:hypothetical protein
MSIGHYIHIYRTYFHVHTTFIYNNRQLGGMFVLDGALTRVIYEFREQYAGDSPKVQQVLRALDIPGANWTDDPDRRILQLAQEAALIKQQSIS